MQLLMVLALAGMLSGALGGAYWGGLDGSALGASSGLVFGVVAWWGAATIHHAVREYRINRHFFIQDNADRDA
jgi:hypothetical protein